MHRILSAGFVALLLLPFPAAGQGWTVAAAAGGTTHQAVAADVGTRNGMLGVRYQGPVRLYLTGGLPLDSESVRWGAAGIEGRAVFDAGPLRAGLELAADGHIYRVEGLEATGTGATLQALPSVSWAGEATRLEVYSGVLQYRRTFSQAGTADLVTRTLHDSGAEASIAADKILLRFRSRYLRAEEDDYPFLGGVASYSTPRAQAWVSAGKWWMDSAGGLAWEFGAGVDLGEAANIYVSVAHEPTDPIYWNAARRRWTVGISRALGTASEATAPLPVVPVDPDGQLTFRLPISEAPSAPSIAGGFTGWEPVRMQRDGDEWIISLPVERGVHHYVYVREDGSYFVPERAASVDDGFGGTSAIIIVQ